MRLIHTMAAVYTINASQQTIDTMAGTDRQPVSMRMLLQGLEQGQQHVPRSAPQHMVARQGVAARHPASLNPLNSGDEVNAKAPEPFIHLGHATLHIVLRPAPRPDIGIFKICKGQPISQGDLGAVLDAVESLQGRVHEGHAAKGVQTQAAQVACFVAVQQVYPVPLIKQIQRGRQPGQASADNEDVGGGDARTHGRHRQT
jgi:hypothetical protein